MRITEIRPEPLFRTYKRRVFPYSLIVVPSTLTGTFTGQGVLTDTQNAFVGQGVFTANINVPLTGNFTGNGFLYQFFDCPRDVLILEYFWPRCTPAIRMPIAYIIKVNMPNDVVDCTPDTATVPATGSFSTIVEGNSVSQNNN